MGVAQTFRVLFATSCSMNWLWAVHLFTVFYTAQRAMLSTLFYTWGYDTHAAFPFSLKMLQVLSLMPAGVFTLIYTYLTSFWSMSYYQTIVKAKGVIEGTTVQAFTAEDSNDSNENEEQPGGKKKKAKKKKKKGQQKYRFSDTGERILVTDDEDTHPFGRKKHRYLMGALNAGVLSVLVLGLALTESDSTTPWAFALLALITAFTGYILFASTSLMGELRRRRKQLEGGERGYKKVQKLFAALEAFSC